MRVLEAGKADYATTQGSGPWANEMRYGVVWWDIIEIS